MNIGSKLNVSLILTILIKASLFGSKSVQGKFSLQPEKESQIALNNFDEEVIPVVLQPWITIFNASEGAKILETYNKKYNEFISLGASLPFLEAKEKVKVLRAGEVGYLYASIKSISDVAVGDTITLADPIFELWFKREYM